MNVYHLYPRTDCKIYAKCGVKSLSHCRRCWERDEECKTCTLIRRKSGNRMRDNLGREMKKCTRCGNYFYPNRFYKRVVVRKGKEYHLLTSWCRMCTAEVNNERAKRKNNSIINKFLV